MITKPDHACLKRQEGVGWHFAHVPLEDIAAYLDRFPPRESWEQQLVRHCQCCGERPAYVEKVWHSKWIVRCQKHAGRNPCLIEGCGRSFKAQGDGRGFWYSNDMVLCGAHWRTLIPPGSPERRVLQRINRVGKKLDWPPRLIDREHRIWSRIVAIARARASGDIDETEIRRMFGWDENEAA